MFNKLIFIFIHFLPSIISNKIRGTSLGSVFVLEPFINPSLFYPFLGNNERVISYSFCDYLGPPEANKRLKKHWVTWVNESTIETLSKSGLNNLRIPVGDYIFIPHGPYAKVVSDNNYTTCFYGSIEKSESPKYLLSYTSIFSFLLFILITFISIILFVIVHHCRRFKRYKMNSYNYVSIDPE